MHSMQTRLGPIFPKNVIAFAIFVRVNKKQEWIQIIINILYAVKTPLLRKLGKNMPANCGHVRLYAWSCATVTIITFL